MRCQKGTKHMLSIRTAEKNDFEAIKSLSKKISDMHAESRPDIYKVPNVYSISLKDFKKVLKSKNIFITVAESKGTVIGYCKWQFKQCINNEYLCDRSVCFIDEFFIEENFRRSGCGKQLYNAVAEKAKNLGASCVELYVWDFNTSAVKFYENMGLTPQRTLLELKFN